MEVVINGVKYKPELTEIPIVKPPLGLKPKFIHDEQRLDEIKDAMERYFHHPKLIPQEWIDEKYDLEKSLSERKQSAPEPSALPDSKQEWEICALRDENGTLWYSDMMPKTGQSIAAVKRLSDNTVWQVGEIFSNNSGGIYTEEKICAFKIENGEMVAYQDKECANGYYDLSSLDKLPITDHPTQPVLFTTEDGVGVVMYQNLFVVELPSYNIANIIKLDGIKHDGSIYLSTKEAAEQFCLKNKPSLSLNDVTNFLHKHFMFDTEYYEALKEIVKQKLNHQ